MIPLTRFFPLLPFVVAAGCSGGGDSGGDDGFGSVAQRPDDFASFAEAGALLGQFDQAGSTLAATPETGFTGTATYAGALGFERASATTGPELIGKLNLEADLGLGTLSGSADNFVDAGGSYVPGTVTLSNGTITPSNATFQVQAAGDIGAGGQSLVFNTPATGDFLGDAADQLTGEFRFGDGSQDWLGVFGAERQ